MKKILLQILFVTMMFLPAQAAQKTITVGTSGTPASLDANFGNAQDNFTELYSIVYVDRYPGDDIGAKFNAAVTANGREHVKYAISPGEYTLSTSVDLTDSRNLTIDLSGAHIHVVGDIIAFDCTQIEDMSFTWAYVTGDATNKPKAFILNAASSGGGANDEGYSQSRAERNKFYGGNIAGYWQYANVIHHGRERSTFTGYYQNNNNSGYVFAITRDGFLVIDEAQVIIESPYNGALSGGSPTKFSIYNASFFSRTNSKDGLLYMQGISGDGSKIDHVEFRSLGEPMIYIADLVGAEFEFLNICGRVGHEAGDVGADFLHFGQNYATSPAYGNITRLRVTGEVTLFNEDAVGGTAFGYFARLPNQVGTGFIEADVDVKIVGRSGGILTNGRAISNGTFRAVNVVDHAYINGVNSFLNAETLNGKATADSNYVSINGVDKSISAVTSSQNFVTGGTTTGVSISNWLAVTNTTYTALQIEGNYGTFQNINVVSTPNDGFDIRGDGNTLIGCSVGSVGATRDTIEFGANADNNKVIGGNFVGAMEFRGTKNIIIGAYINGNVDFIAGSSGNKLIGCVVTGTITDGGTDNIY